MPLSLMKAVRNEAIMTTEEVELGLSSQNDCCPIDRPVARSNLERTWPKQKYRYSLTSRQHHQIPCKKRSLKTLAHVGMS